MRSWPKWKISRPVCNGRLSLTAVWRKLSKCKLRHLIRLQRHNFQKLLDLPISGIELLGSSWSGGEAGWRRWVPAVDLRIRWPGGDLLAPLLGRSAGWAGGGGGGGGPITIAGLCRLDGNGGGGGVIRFEGPGLVDEDTTEWLFVDRLILLLLLVKRRCCCCCNIGRNSGWNWWDGLTITSILGGAIWSLACSSFINNSGRIKRMTLLCLLCCWLDSVWSLVVVSCCRSAPRTCSSTQLLSGEACSLLVPAGCRLLFMIVLGKTTTVSLLSATLDSTAIPISFESCVSHFCTTPNTLTHTHTYTRKS